MLEQGFLSILTKLGDFMIAQSSQNLEITVQKRDTNVPAQALRRQDLVPIILYGRDIKDPLSLVMPLSIFDKVYKEAGETTIIDLKIEGEEKVYPVLIKDLQLDPVTNQHIHIDLYAIKAGEKLHATVPLVFEGEAPAVKDFGSILVTNKNEIEVECLPKDLPKEIVVDISILKEIDSSISVQELKIPAGVEVLDDPEDSVIVATPPAAEEEEETVSEEEALESIEATEEKSSGEEGEGEKESGKEKPKEESDSKES